VDLFHHPGASKNRFNPVPSFLNYKDSYFFSLRLHFLKPTIHVLLK
jgi:hypothetical protein